MSAVQQHLDSLMEKHRRLDHQIVEETAHPGFDALKLKELKRRKLKLKEEIDRLSH